MNKLRCFDAISEINNLTIIILLELNVRSSVRTENMADKIIEVFCLFFFLFFSKVNEWHLIGLKFLLNTHVYDIELLPTK